MAIIDKSKKIGTGTDNKGLVTVTVPVSTKNVPLITTSNKDVTIIDKIKAAGKSMKIKSAIDEVERVPYKQKWEVINTPAGSIYDTLDNILIFWKTYPCCRTIDIHRNHMLKLNFSTNDTPLEVYIGIINCTFVCSKTDVLKRTELPVIGLKDKRYLIESRTKYNRLEPICGTCIVTQCPIKLFEIDKNIRRTIERLHASRTSNSYAFNANTLVLHEMKKSD